MKTPEEISEILKNSWPDEEIELKKGDVGEPWIEIPAGKLAEIATFLRDNSALQFNSLMCLSGIHYNKENELGVTYNLDSTILNQKISIKVRVPEENAVVPSVESVWKTAKWHEREAYDMIGLQFENHPNLKRILLPDDWEGHPLRKDYVQQEFYQGMPTGNE